MKKTILFIILCFSAVGCSIERPPNPGFRVDTFYVDATGLFQIRNRARFTVTSGSWQEDILGSQELSGTLRNFPGTSSGSNGYFDVPGRRAPAAWYFNADSDWGGCDNQGIVLEANPGKSTEIACVRGRFRPGIMFPFVPSTIYSNSSTVELKATLGGVNMSYGMPIFHFENYAGELVATTTATYVNGIDVRTNSSCLAGQPVGTYTVKVYNAPGQNTSPNNSLGFSTISTLR